MFSTPGLDECFSQEDAAIAIFGATFCLITMPQMVWLHTEAKSYCYTFQIIGGNSITGSSIGSCVTTHS